MKEYLIGKKVFKRNINTKSKEIFYLVIPEADNSFYCNILNYLEFFIKVNHYHKAVLICESDVLKKLTTIFVEKQCEVVVLEKKQMENLIVYLRTLIDAIGQLTYKNIMVFSFGFPQRDYTDSLIGKVFTLKHMIWYRLYHYHFIYAPEAEDYPLNYQGNDPEIITILNEWRQNEG